MILKFIHTMLLQTLKPRDETPTKVNDNNKRKIPTKAERLANFVCEHCNIANHYGIDCIHLSTTDAMRAQSQSTKDSKIAERDMKYKKKQSRSD